MPGDVVGDRVGGVSGGNVDSSNDLAIKDKTKVHLTLNRLLRILQLEQGSTRQE